MAELIELRLEDFRAFREATLELTAHGLVLVAGPNNVGKSALLSAFDAIAGGVASEALRHAAGQQAGLWAKWQLTDEERTTLLGSTSETERLMTQGAASWLEWEFREFQNTIQPVSVSISWPEIDRLEFASIEETGGMNWKMSIPTGPLATWDRTHSTGSSGGGQVADTLAYFGNNAVLPVEILRHWRTGYFHFRPLREVRGRTAALNSVSQVLDRDGGNLATVLLYLYTNSPETWDQLVRLVQQIVPGVGRLMVPVNGSECRIVFQDEQVASHQHNIKDLGTGVEQILMTLVLGLTQTATTVVLEEPETGLHASAQRALLGLLQDWSKDRLFVASTHSATMLDWTSTSTAVLSVSRSGIESTAVPVTTERAAILRQLGVRLSDVLSAERILIIEGPTDKDIFETWFPDVMRDPRLVALPGGGGYNARHADLLADWLNVADSLEQRRILYVRDRDELSAAFLEKLDASTNIYVLKCRELENLLLDFDAITVVLNDERTRTGKEELTVEGVASVAKLLADDLKPIVVLKRAMADLAEPIRLVDNKLRGALAKSKADEAALKTSVLARIPSKATVRKEISASWKAHSKEIAGTWDENWQDMVPGADLLTELWKKFLDRGYSKAKDGLAIAREMKDPPEGLTKTLRDFMAEASSAD